VLVITTATYAKKRHEAPSRRGTDIGNAVFWKTSAFSYVDHDEVLLEKVLWEKCSSTESKQVFASGFPQVALFVQLQHIESKKNVVISTTHICAAYQTPYVQLMQVMACIDQLKKYAKTPLILAGDFNSIPTTAVYSLLSNSSVPSDSPTLQLLQKMKIKPPFKSFKHELGLKSAYCSVLGREPRCTNLTHEFKGTLDYIWYSKNSLSPLAVLDIPETGTLREEVGLPSSKFPSDHLLLYCVLRFDK